ncbi:MAG: aminotransferase class I/II-fold pyridoxal phosphate-dependent enzyme [Pirellulales bacterium]
MAHPWVAKRTALVDSSGIRKVFDLAASMRDPINLSIGQPDFDVPEPIQEAAIAAIRDGKNGYSVTQGIAPLRDALQTRINEQLGHTDRKVLITSGTSGALVLTMLAMVEPGDEVIIPDPYFVMYPALIGMVGGRPVAVDTYPDFRFDPARVAAAITPQTKMILVNSPANPTGAVANKADMRALAELAAKHNIALVSDEIYRAFSYEGEPASPAPFNEQTIVIDGFSKTYGITGWRLGFAHGPAEIIDKMAMLQQYTFVCAPQPAQWAGLAALEVDMTRHVEEYRRRRDLLLDGLADCYEIARPGGAFYAFPRVPRGTGTEFVTRAIQNELLVIPGSVFSGRDTHFRISYAASEQTIERGVEVLRRLAAG